MEEFKKYPDTKLASIMVNQINRVEHLRQMIAGYLDSPNHGSILADNIKAEYIVTGIDRFPNL